MTFCPASCAKDCATMEGGEAAFSDSDCVPENALAVLMEALPWITSQPFCPWSEPTENPSTDSKSALNGSTICAGKRSWHINAKPIKIAAQNRGEVGIVGIAEHFSR